MKADPAQTWCHCYRTHDSTICKKIIILNSIDREKLCLEGYIDFDAVPTLITTGYDTVRPNNLFVQERTILFGPVPGVSRGHFQ